MRLLNARSRFTVTVDRTAQVCVTIVYSPAPRAVHELVLTLEAGSTVAHAVTMAARRGVTVPPESCTGVWGKKAEPGQLLVNGDRVEVYRALKVDPKIARRLRFAGQGAKSAGLFSNRRAGAKAGY